MTGADQCEEEYLNQSFVSVQWGESGLLFGRRLQYNRMPPSHISEIFLANISGSFVASDFGPASSIMFLNPNHCTIKIQADNARKILKINLSHMGYTEKSLHYLNTGRHYPHVFLQISENLANILESLVTSDYEKNHCTMEIQADITRSLLC